jgi:hypothetical protein
VVSAIVDEVIAAEPMDVELPGRMPAQGDECWQQPLFLAIPKAFGAFYMSC